MNKDIHHLNTMETHVNTSSPLVHENTCEDVDKNKNNGHLSSSLASGVSSTYESTYAVPGWIVMNKNIINTSNISMIIRRTDSIEILCYNKWISVPVDNINETWPTLQTLFTKGIKQ
jgi:hypothetical protein